MFFNISLNLFENVEATHIDVTNNVVNLNNIIINCLLMIILEMEQNETCFERILFGKFKLIKYIVFFFIYIPFLYIIKYYIEDQ